MAVAEEKATWKQTINRCSTNDKDAFAFQKKSPSSSMKLKSDGHPGNAGDRSKHAVLDHIAYNKNISCPDEQPDAKWWLHPKYYFSHSKDISHEHFTSPETELEVLDAVPVSPTAKFSGECKLIDEYDARTHSKANAALCLDQPQKFTSSRVQNDQNSWNQELKVACSDLSKEPTDKDIVEFWCAYNQLEFDNCLVLEQPEKLLSDEDSLWTGVDKTGDKTGPWWRTSDKDDLASLVSYKLLEYIENCDLPCPRSYHMQKKPLFHDKRIPTFSESMVEKELHNVSGYVQGTASSVNSNETVGRLYSQSTTVKSSWNDFPMTTKSNKEEINLKPYSDLSKSQLLEALCHSQTRARKAEKAAQQAHEEKEHILKILFRQASYLFAYKQWLQILQLESICLQLRSKDPLLANHLSEFFPWISCKGRKMKGHRCKAAKRRQVPPKVNKCAIAFAVGLSLAGAGLLLGWTMGWLFPSL